MTLHWLNTTRLGQLLAGLTVLMVVALLALVRLIDQPSHTQSSPTQLNPAQSSASALAGNYRGSVDFEWTLVGELSDPLPTPAAPLTNSTASADLGVIDLGLVLTQAGTVITGYVDLDVTLVFSIEHTLSGSPAVKTGPNVQGSFDGTNLTLTSEKVNVNLNGRALQRQFTLQGSIVSGDPARVSGQYRETLWGYAPQPVTVLGKFSLLRADFEDNVPDTTNKVPDAGADIVTANSGVATTLNVLANDSDANGDALAITSVSKPQFGSATTNGQTVTYTANANFVGSDTFSYIVSDGKGGEAAGSVTVTVNGSGGQSIYLPVIQR